MITVEERQRHSARELDPNNPLAVVAPSQTFETVSAQISGIVLRRKPPLFWWLTFGGGVLLLMVFTIAVIYLEAKGVGIWGVEIPVAWAFAITNFVWWIGIGHAGTLISAILLLLNQGWRNSINRFAEAMTIFAVACAGIFPLLHLGRAWIFYWLLPYPNTMTIQPQFRSPLVWDVFAVSTYATVSILFWYLGMIPDLATLRDRSGGGWKYGFYGVLAFGWRGSSRHWKWQQSASLMLAGLATPLVLSVHTVVSFDFTIAILPGWHSTIFPPYFVAGAIYSGFAMVLVLCIPLRAVYGLHNLITERHLNNCAKLMLANGLDSCLHVCHRTVHFLVQRQWLRDVYGSQPCFRTSILDILAGHPSERPHSPITVVLQGPDESKTVIFCCDGGARLGCGWSAT